MELWNLTLSWNKHPLYKGPVTWMCEIQCKRIQIFFRWSCYWQLWDFALFICQLSNMYSGMMSTISIVFKYNLEKHECYTFIRPWTWAGIWLIVRNYYCGLGGNIEVQHKCKYLGCSLPQSWKVLQVFCWVRILVLYLTSSSEE